LEKIAKIAASVTFQGAKKGKASHREQGTGWGHKNDRSGVIRGGELEKQFGPTLSQ